MNARSANEGIKGRSRYLRGTIAEGLRDRISGALAEEDTQLTKFHGIYQQDDRDLRAERAKKLLDKAYIFMARLRVPGGVLTPAQWLAMQAIAEERGNGTLRLTTRQTIQFHGVIKSNLKSAIQAINRAMLDTIAACGDVNRNVICTPNPYRSAVHAEAIGLARRISEHLRPRTRAYHEIWLRDLNAGSEHVQTAMAGLGPAIHDFPDEPKTWVPRTAGPQFAAGVGTPRPGMTVTDDVLAKSSDPEWVTFSKQVVGEEEEEEPIYGPTYMPRKFKIALAVPPLNDVDVFAHDLGFIAVEQNGSLIGWNVVVGGGMGMTHGEPDTYPRLGDVIGFCAPEHAVDVAEKVVTIQRDWGDRADRKHARLKYTIERRGLDRFCAELDSRLGWPLAPARSFAFERSGDPEGWLKGDDGLWHYVLFVENGRVRDLRERRLLSGLNAIARAHAGEFIITPNQNLIIARVPAGKKRVIQKLLAAHGLAAPVGALRRNAMACVALPTCGLALAESERYLPDLVTALEAELQKHGLGRDEITIRMTGCPNGCARPYLAEIGLVGRGPGVYNLYLGGAFEGTRLNKLYRKDVRHAEIVAALAPLFAAFAAGRRADERFADFAIRTGVIAPTTAGNRFHEDLAPELAA